MSETTECDYLVIGGGAAGCIGACQQIKHRQ